MAEILLFGVLAEKAGESVIVVEDISSVDELIIKVSKRYPSFAKYNFKVSINRKLVHENVEIKSNDEIALLPPFAGG